MLAELWYFQISMMFPKIKENRVLSHSWRSEGHVLYEKLLEKWVLRLRWGIKHVSTISGSRYMAFCRFCLNLFHNLTKRSQNHPNLKHFGGGQLKPSKGHPRGPKTTIRLLPQRWGRWTPLGPGLLSRTLVIKDWIQIAHLWRKVISFYYEQVLC